METVLLHSTPASRHVPERYHDCKATSTIEDNLNLVPVSSNCSFPPDNVIAVKCNLRMSKWSKTEFRPPRYPEFILIHFNRVQESPTFLFWTGRLVDSTMPGRTIEVGYPYGARSVLLSIWEQQTAEADSQSLERDWVVFLSFKFRVDYFAQVIILGRKEHWKKADRSRTAGLTTDNLF